MRALRIWFSFMVTVIIFGSVGYSLYLARQDMKTAGQAWAQVLTEFPYLLLIAVGAGTILMIVFGLAFGLKYLLRWDFTDIGQHGTIMHRYHQVRDVTPYSSTVIAPHANKKKIEASLVVPTVTELLKNGMLGTIDLLFGYQLDGTPLWGKWDEINTFCVAGKSRSGKTITLFFIIIQALLNNAVVWVCDPHGAGRKQSALKRLLSPLEQWIRFACTSEEIAEMCDEFMDIMIARIDGNTDDFTPHLFVCDEFNGAAEENPRLYDLVNRCAREWAGVYGYAAIAGHEWTQSGKASQGLAKMRRNLHAKFVHRLEKDYARFLLSGKYPQLADKLRTGHNYFVNIEGETTVIVTPLGKVEDAVTVAEQLLQLSGPEYIPSIEEKKRFVPETDRFVMPETERETDHFVPRMINSPIKSEPETQHFVSEHDRKKDKVNKMLGKFTETDIICTVWNVTAGGSEAYQVAREEFKQIKEELKREVVA